MEIDLSLIWGWKIVLKTLKPRHNPIYRQLKFSPPHHVTITSHHITICVRAPWTPWKSLPWNTLRYREKWKWKTLTFQLRFDLCRSFAAQFARVVATSCNRVRAHFISKRMAIQTICTLPGRNENWFFFSGLIMGGKLYVPRRKENWFFFSLLMTLDSQEVEDSGGEIPLSQSSLCNYEVTRYMQHREIMKPYFTKNEELCGVQTMYRIHPICGVRAASDICRASVIGRCEPSKAVKQRCNASTRSTRKARL